MINISAVPPKAAYEYAGVFNNVYQADKGQGLAKHTHTYAHLTICVAGSIAVYKENVYKTLSPNDGPVVLKEDEWHAIEALEPGTVFVNSYSADLVRSS